MVRCVLPLGQGGGHLQHRDFLETAELPIEVQGAGKHRALAKTCARDNTKIVVGVIRFHARSPA